MRKMGIEMTLQERREKSSYWNKKEKTQTWIYKTTEENHRNNYDTSHA